MKFSNTKLKDAIIIDVEPFNDNRGMFARTFCAREFAEHAPDAATPLQANTSFNHKAGTIRGMHYQLPPHEETKLVRCVRGALVDVIVDVRPDSPTFKQWIAVELTADNRRSLLVPRGFAHGFQTLEDNTEAVYQVSAFYTPGAERGLRFNDPAIGIEWPLPVSVISDKDANWPDFNIV